MIQEAETAEEVYNIVINYEAVPEEESDEYIRDIWHKHYLEECGHLAHVASLLNKYEGKPWQSVFTCGGDFPAPIKLESNIDYVREVLKNTVHNTGCMEGYCKVSELDKDANFFKYNKTVNGNVESVQSHAIIKDFIAKNGEDYRFETAENPVPELRDRTKDNTSVGRE